MNELSLFTGGGGGVYASLLLGHRVVGYVESDSYCQKIIRQRIKDGIFEDAPLFADVRTFNGRPYRSRVDLISAGFPCQPFSVAGKRQGENDDRNLWPDTARIIGEVQPRFVFLENSPRLASLEYFGVILKDLAEAGYDAVWRIISARDLGALHERKRLWLLATDAERSELRNEPRWCSGENGEDSNVSRNDGAEEPVADSYSQSLERTSEPRGECNYWSIEPDVGRVVDGVAARSKQLRALGNGQVPIVAATAFRILMNDLLSE